MMFRAKTVLVIGAGASAELGLPMGSELLSNIRELLNLRFNHGHTPISGDPMIVEGLAHYLGGYTQSEAINAHLEAGHRIRVSSLQAMSIDNLVDALEDPAITLVAKMAIVRAIHQAESSSLCMVSQGDRDLDLARFSNTWYGSFSKLLFEGVRKSEVETIFTNLEIINFNYDRCLETYLPYSLAKYYGYSADEMKAIVGRLKIHRPYGIAGSLEKVRFGGGGGAQHLAEVAQSIRTFTEQIEDDGELNGIKSAVSEADRIIFLGFGFHRQNVKLLEADTKEDVEVLATAFGISKSDRGVIAKEVCEAFEIYTGTAVPLFEQSVEMAPMQCAQFFSEYWRTLTAEPQQ